MGISIDQTGARRVLAQAIELAESNASLPTYWTELTRDMEGGPLTYVPALGTAMLAKATDPRIDPLSIKAAYSERSYSLRTLGHSVLVPASKDDVHGFDLKAQGREPLNNQPFFRYDHMALIDRVRATSQFPRLLEGLEALDQLTEGEALEALAAFIRERQAVRRSRPAFDLSAVRATVQELVTKISPYLEPSEGDLPARAQAIVAGVLKSAYPDISVTTSKLHDPSRRAPGDVVMWEDLLPLRSVEVRTKPVLPSDAQGFVDACARAGLSAASIAILAAPAHAGLDRDSLIERGLRQGVIVTVTESTLELVTEAVAWSVDDLSGFDELPDYALAFLDEVGATGESIAAWHSLWPSGPAGASSL